MPTRSSPCDVTGFSAEFQLACACCRVTPTARDLATIERLLPQIDVPAFIDLVVSRHRIGPLVQACLKHVPAALWPAGLAGPLAAEARANAVKALRALRTLAFFQRWFAAAGIEWLPFKGVTVGERYYGTAGLRHVNDHDIWVPVHRLEAARNVLAEKGFIWNPQETCWDLAPRGPRHRNFLLRYHFEEVHRSAEHGRVELHWRMTENLSLFTLQPEQLLASAEWLAVGDTDVPAMNDVDHLLYLCDHGSRHCWCRLKWLADLPQLLDRKAWDWDQLLTRAQQAQCTPSLLLGLSLARDLFGWNPPHEIERRLERAAPLTDFASRAVRVGLQAPESWWSAPNPLPLSWHFRWAVNRMLMSSNGRAAFHVLWRLSLTPGDLRVLNLPDRMFAVYHILRPALRGVRRWRVVRRAGKMHDGAGVA